MTKSSKDLWKSILLALLIPLLGWATWVTAQTYNAQQTKQELTEYRAYADQEQQDIKREIRGLRDRVDQNHQTVYSTLLDIQKQLGNKRK